MATSTSAAAATLETFEKLDRRRGVQVREFESEALALAWRNRNTLLAAPARRALQPAAPAALVAHEEND